MLHPEGFAFLEFRETRRLIIHTIAEVNTYQIYRKQSDFTKAKIHFSGILVGPH